MPERDRGMNILEGAQNTHIDQLSALHVEGDVRNQYVIVSAEEMGEDWPLILIQNMLLNTFTPTERMNTFEVEGDVVNQYIFVAAEAGGQSQASTAEWIQN